MKEEKKQSQAQNEPEVINIDIVEGKPTPDIQSLCMNCGD